MQQLFHVRCFDMSISLGISLFLPDKVSNWIIAINYCTVTVVTAIVTTMTVDKCFLLSVHTTNHDKIIMCSFSSLTSNLARRISAIRLGDVIITVKTWFDCKSVDYA